MRTQVSIRPAILSALLAYTIASPALAERALQAEPDPGTNQAIQLFRQGNLDEAVETELKVAKEKPRDWLPRATLSFLYWQQGNVPDAIVEGQKAVRYAPRSPVALINLARMYQALESYDDAIRLYRDARSAAPAEWVPGLGLVQCYVRSGKPEEARAVLQAMASQQDQSFDWYYQVGKAYLTMDEPGPAVESLERARKLSGTEDQEFASTLQLFIALVRDHQIERAADLKGRIFDRDRPRESEAYVLAASELLRAGDPDSAETLLQSATRNLDETKDSDGFYRLGRVFEGKAAEVEGDRSRVGLWLEKAKRAYNQALDLNPGQARCYLALASLGVKSGDFRAIREDLEKARSIDRSDLLAPYLASHINSAVPLERSGSAIDSSAQPSQAGGLNLTEVRFKINDLPCACLIAKIESAMMSIKGVAFLSLSRLKPYDGTLLVDQSMTLVDDVFVQGLKNALGTEANAQSPITFDVLSRQPVSSLDAAVDVAQRSRYGDALKFVRQFEMIPPSLPVEPGHVTAASVH